MADSKIYSDIFEAVHQLEPGCPLYNCKLKGGTLQHFQQLTLLDLGDGSIAAVPLSAGMMYYRGENKLYDTCKPNLYRYRDVCEREIWQIRTCDFELFLLETGEMKRRAQTEEKIDLLAIAQHYGFPTNMLDVTNDIVVAAYFATHRFNPVTMCMEAEMEGVGRLRWMSGLFGMAGDHPVRIFGDQYFARPRVQSGFGIEMKEEDDFAEFSGHIEFNQSAEMSMIMDQAFDGMGMFFPNEQIDWVAKRIQRENAVTRMGIKRYAEKSGRQAEELEQMVKGRGIYIVDAPLCHPAVQIS